MVSQRKPRQSRPSQIQDERPTGPDNFVADVVFRVECFTHNADLGFACHYAQGIADGHPVTGVCNSRALAAGFNGKINPLSLTRRPYERTAPVAQ